MLFLKIILYIFGYVFFYINYHFASFHEKPYWLFSFIGVAE